MTPRTFQRPCALFIWLILCATGTPGQEQIRVRGNPDAPRHVRLFPQFQQGQKFYYQLDFRSRTSGAVVGLIATPEPLKEMELSVSALIRLEVLSVTPGALTGARPLVRLRTTYEKLASTVRSDVPDPEANHLGEQIQRLENKSLEFTIGTNGTLSEVTGLEDIFPGQQSVLKEWLKEAGFTASLPEEGIYPGMKWSSDLTAGAALPLAGFIWRNESSYLRDEPCQTVRISLQGQAAQKPDPESCAVVFGTQILISKSKLSDRTPPEFRAENLRTAGTIQGRGESLTYISLVTGMVVSVTQSGRQEMDITIAPSKGDSSLRYKGRVETHSHLSLVTDLSALPTDLPK